MQNKSKIIVNVFSNWTNLIVLIGIAFFVSPILVHNLGNENYGLWTLIVSITGLYTVLDFGVITAIVRFISMHVARKNEQKANEVYCTSFIFYFGISVIVILITAIFGGFFKKTFNIKSWSDSYIYFLLFIVGTDIALSLLFSVLLGTLTALQEFVKINIFAITTTIAKNIILVIMILNGYKLITLAIIQISANLLKYLMQYIAIRRKYEFFHFKLANFNKSTCQQIFSYSIYSFIIAIALKILFYTDNIVIGRMISVSYVTFYTIPATLLEYSEKFLWTVTMVLIPVISASDAVGDHEKIEGIYHDVSKYSLLLSLPVVFVLYTKGPDFISIWMGEEYGNRATWLLRILLIGYGFSFPQTIAHGILKGISKPKFYAYVLIVEAVANLIISVILAPIYGIEGVALGTTIPLIIVNTIVVPVYMCRVLQINIFHYVWAAYSKPSLCLFILAILSNYFSITVLTYFDLALYALYVTLFVSVFSLIFITKNTERRWALSKIRHWLSMTT